MINIIEKQIALDIEFDSRDKALKEISKICFKSEIINEKDINILYKSFIERENEVSTGFENGFAIPHARIEQIKKPSIVFLRLKKGVDWKSLDGKPTKYIVALLVPIKDASDKHMNILSSVAVGLLNDDFTNTLKNSKSKNEIIKSFKKIMSNKNENSNRNFKKNEAGKKNILAITACPVGIAHTYLAAEKIEKVSEVNLNYNIKVETHGSIGVKNKFTDEEIENADVIIIASDVSVDKSRFNGKKVYTTSLKKAINDPVNLIKIALDTKEVHLNSSKVSEMKKSNTGFDSEKKSFFIKHLLSGVSYMIPFIIFGGLLIALQVGLGRIIYGDSGRIPENDPLFYIGGIGGAAFTLMIPILAGFIANSIAGRSAIAPAAIVALASNMPVLIYLIPGLEGITSSEQTPLGFLGAIFYGFLIGYTVKWMNTWKIHKNITALMPIFIIPIGVTLFYGLLAIFIINAPISFVMLKIGDAMQSLFERTEDNQISQGAQIGIGIGMGAVLGAMAGFDMGGPINKIAFITASALLTLSTPINEPMGMVAAAIPIAPLGMGVATFVYKKHFTNEQRTIGASAIVMGTIGISEGAIPFAISDPKRAILANVIGSAVAGAIAGALGVTGAVPHGGPIVGILGAVGGSYIGGTSIAIQGFGIAFFFLAIIIGTITTVLMYGLFLKTIHYKDENEIKNKKENKFIIHTKNLKLKINNSSAMVYTRKNHMIIGEIIMVVLGIGLLITGITLSGVHGADFANLVEFYKEQFDTGVVDVPPFNFPEIIYGVFGILTGLLLLLASFMYWFTVKENRNQINIKV
ncbi:MAG: PTS fructose transporter subunit IIABC [Mycoplasmoidaceae bacterium]